MPLRGDVPVMAQVKAHDTIQGRIHGYAVTANNLTKSFKDGVALHAVSLTVQEGACVGIIGPNGAGKSTLMRLMALVDTPNSGSLLFNGQDSTADAPSLREHIGYAPQDVALFEELTAYDNLNLYARSDKAGTRQRVAHLTEVLGMGAFLHRKVALLSGGMKRRVNLAVALVNEPAMLVADEPFAGLDFQQRRQVIAYLKGLREQGMTQILSSHYPENFVGLADSVIYLESGTIVGKA